MLEPLPPQIAARPLYTAAEAARITGLPAKAISRWGGSTTAMAVRADRRGAPTISFSRLVAFVVYDGMRACGGPVARHAEGACLHLDMSLPGGLCSDRVQSEGPLLLAAAPFAAAVEDLGGGPRWAPPVQSRLGCIDYAGGRARLIRLLGFPPAVEIVCDPMRSAGQPIFARGAARVFDVLSRVEAGDTIASVAADFGCPAGHVEAALFHRDRFFPPRRRPRI